LGHNPFRAVILEAPPTDRLWPLAVCHLLTCKVTYFAINLLPRSR
jgi:hypothetical protein